MSKSYSIEEIQRALEFWEATKHCKSVWDGFQHMMKFAAGIHEVDNKAMERLQELVENDKVIVIGNVDFGENGEVEVTVDDLAKFKAEFGGNWKKSIRKTVSEAILNLKVEK